LLLLLMSRAIYIYFVYFVNGNALFLLSAADAF